MEWYLAAWKKYAVFSGRSRRKEYWDFVLLNSLASIILSIIDSNIGASINTDYGIGIGILSSLFSLAILVPNLAVSVRRLHDTNHSGWWLFLGLIPLLGGIVLLVFYLTDSQPGDNQYGPNPKVEMITTT